jgi:glutamyl/glutaminyl-tRNA synthetase
MTEDQAVTSTPVNDAGNAPVDDQAVNTTPDATNAQPEETKAEAPAVPESYEFKMPDGVELDKAAATEFTEIAKELKLDQSTAQKVADVGAKMVQRQAEAHAKLVETWVEQVKTDNEIGGDKLDQNLAIARKAMDAFGTPELKDVLNSTGLGNHPAVIKAFYKAGKAISEDKFVAGSPKGPETDMAKRMFPSMN